MSRLDYAKTGFYPAVIGSRDNNIIIAFLLEYKFCQIYKYKCL